MKSNKKVSSGGGTDNGIPPYPRIYVRSPPQYRRHHLMRKTSLEPLQPVLASPANESDQPTTLKTVFNQPTREPKKNVRKVRSRTSSKSLQKVMTWNCQSPEIKKPDQFPVSDDFGELIVPELEEDASTPSQKTAPTRKIIPKAMTNSNASTNGRGTRQENGTKVKREISQTTRSAKTRQLNPVTTTRRAKDLRPSLSSTQKIKGKEIQQVRDVLSPNYEPPRPRMSPMSVAGRAKLKPQYPITKNKFRAKPREMKLKEQFSNNHFPRTVSELRTKTVNIGPRSIGRNIKSDERLVETKPDNTQAYGPSSYRRKSSNPPTGVSHAFITETSLPPFEAQSGNRCDSDRNTPMSTSSRRDSEGGYCPGGSSSSDFENDPMLVKLTNESERFSPTSKQTISMDKGKMQQCTKRRNPIKVADEQTNLHLKVVEEHGKKLQSVRIQRPTRREWDNSVDGELKACRSQILQPKVTDTPSHHNVEPKFTGEKHQRPETPLTRIYGTVSSNIVHFNTYRERRIVANQAAQNVHLYSWIKNAKPTYSRIKQLQDFKKHQAFKAFKTTNM